ncbi:DUF6130 family protein [Curvibacter gracilis]|uniref:DUF6130 family protein n=1 Tax=Curvibacter gracilis TaxID=230310 RepID=UPI0005BD87BC|nr:DUF6130 family protein [Curvibacter gracilis]
MPSLLIASRLAVQTLIGLAVIAACQSRSAAHETEAPRAEQPAAQAPVAAPRLRVDAPLAGPLTRGVVVVPFQAENLQIAPVYGSAAAKVVPRIGHLHLTVDNAAWHWVQASPDLIVLQGLDAGPHTLRIDLADAQHQVLHSQTVGFTVPQH